MLVNWFTGLEMKYDSSKPIDDLAVYHITTNKFLADGSDGFVVFTEG